MSDTPFPPSPAASTDLARIKVPPHSREAEQAVLGGLMLNNEAWFTVAERVQAVDFYQSGHQKIFEVMAQLVEQNQPLDALTLSEALSSLEVLDTAGGLAYLAELAENTPAADNVPAYADIVRERSILRQLIGAAHRIADAAFRPEGRDSAVLLDEAEREVFQIAEGRPKQGGPQSAPDLLKKAVEKIDFLFRNQQTITGLPTGFTQLDEMTAGLQDGDMVVVAARPSMGKTALAMNLAEHALMDTKREGPVLVFSMEMPAESLMMRLLSSLGRIHAGNMRTGRLSDDDWPRLTSTVNLLKDRPLFIDDTPALSPTEMRARARRLVREHGNMKMILVDYLQLMQVAGTKENRTGEISEISRSLKALAKEMSCPVVALSQLNRSLEQRPNKRPVMSDLRESGAIEQDADVILFIYRDEVYNEDSPDKGTAEIIIGKQRNGPIGTCRLAFLGHLTKFENLADDRYEGFQ